MKKIIQSTLVLILTGFLSVTALGYYKFNYTQDDIYIQMSNGSVISANKYDEMLDGVHPSWDRDNDGVNDCEISASCDDFINYSKPFRLINEP